MDWIFRKKGEINHYNEEIHQGSQPIRVVNHMLLYMFQNTHSDFYEELVQQIEEGKVNREFAILFGELPLLIENGKYRTPRVNFETKKIELPETFLSYLWCCTYSIFVLYVETVDFPKLNKQNGYISHAINQVNIEKAYEVFDYAKYLIVDFQPWNKSELPNPEIYLAENRDYVEQTNIYYTEAVKFILCHEFTHLKIHAEKINNTLLSSHYLAFEKEADECAIDMMVRGMPVSRNPFAFAHRLAMQNGIIFGILSMFFFASNTRAVKHPYAEDRLTDALERLNLNDNPYVWGIACVGLKLWDKQFSLELDWDSNVVSDREQYYKIIDQIKRRH